MKEHCRLLDILKKVKCFSALDEKTLQLLLDEMRLHIFETGQYICTEGETGDKMFIIESGEVSVIKRGEKDIPVEIAILKRGDIAGEMGLFGQSVRSASLRACCETKTWALEYSVFNRLLDTHSGFARELLSYINTHLCRETSVVAKLLSNDIEPNFKIAFFDSKPYMKDIFLERNKYNYCINFFESRLSLETVFMAAGFKAICVFVNDVLNEPVIKELHAMGIRMIALRCAGFNNVDLKACKKYGIIVMRVPAYSPHAVAEHAVALMLTLNRHIHRANNRVREANFSLNGLLGFDMHGKTAGIIGAGKIGKCVLQILKGFGCKLLVYARTPDRKLEEQLGVIFVEKDQLFAESDIITLHAPLTPETHHLINADVIEKLKDGVMLINTSRGGLVDTSALIDGLKSGKIGYAGLDVYEEESNYFFEDCSGDIMTDDMLARLTTFNNVLVTSHQAFLTREALCNIADTTLANIRSFELEKHTKKPPSTEFTDCCVCGLN